MLRARYLNDEKSTKKQENGGKSLEAHQQNDQENSLWTWDAPHTINGV